MKVFGKSIRSAAAMMCAATMVAVLRAGAQSTGAPAGSPATSPQTPQQAGALAGAAAAQVGANLAGPVAQAAADHGNAGDRKPETIALPPGEKVFAYTMGSDGIRRTIVKRTDGTLYVLGGQPVPRTGPNNYLNRPLGEEPIPQTQERPGTGNSHAVPGSDQEDPNAKRPTYSEEREKALREGVVRKAQRGQRPH